MLVADLSVLWMLMGEAMVLRVMMWVEGAGYGYWIEHD